MLKINVLGEKCVSKFCEFFSNISFLDKSNKPPVNIWSCNLAMNLLRIGSMRWTTEYSRRGLKAMRVEGRKKERERKRAKVSDYNGQFINQLNSTQLSPLLTVHYFYCIYIYEHPQSSPSSENDWQVAGQDWSGFYHICQGNCGDRKDFYFTRNIRGYI